MKKRAIPNQIPDDLKNLSVKPSPKVGGGFFFRTQTCVDRTSFALYSLWGGHDKLRSLLLEKGVSGLPSLSELSGMQARRMDGFESKIQCPMNPDAFKIFDALGGRHWLRAFLSSRLFFQELKRSGAVPEADFIKVKTPDEDADPVLLKLIQENVACGFPSPALDYTSDEIDLAAHLCPNPAATVLMRAEGDSMLDAGISPGDILVVARSAQARPGSIVIASAQGQLTVKRLVKRNGSFVLHSENEEQGYPDIVPGQFLEVQLVGVVRHVIKSFP